MGEQSFFKMEMKELLRVKQGGKNIKDSAALCRAAERPLISWLEMKEFWPLTSQMGGVLVGKDKDLDSENGGLSDAIALWAFSFL